MLQDGFILSALLAHPSVNIKTLPQALKVYDEFRRPFSQNVQRLSDASGSMYQLDAMGWENVSAEESTAGQYPPELLSQLNQKMVETHMWVGEGDFMKARQKALEQLERAFS